MHLHDDPRQGFPLTPEKESTETPWIVKLFAAIFMFIVMSALIFAVLVPVTIGIARRTWDWAGN